MGIIAWIALGTAVGLLANMLHPQQRSRALISSAWLAVLAEAAGPAAGLPPAKGSHHSSFGIMIGPSAPRSAVIGVCTVREAMASDPRGGLPLLSIHATVVSLSAPGSVRTMCSLAASDFRVEGGETRDRSCDQATLRERGAA